MKKKIGIFLRKKKGKKLKRFIFNLEIFEVTVVGSTNAKRGGERLVWILILVWAEWKKKEFHLRGSSTFGWCPAKKKFPSNQKKKFPVPSSCSSVWKNKKIKK